MPQVSPTPEPAEYQPTESDLYEVTWMSGHIERVTATDISFFNERVNFLVDAGSRMRLVLSAREEDLRTIRSVTEDESLPLGGGEPV